MVLLPRREDQGRGADGHEGYLRMVRQPWDKVQDKVLLQAGFPGHGQSLEFLYLPEGED